MREPLKKELNELEEQGIIRKSSSNYASPIVLVKKKDNTIRICPDYRKLNKITLFDPEPMVTAEDLIQKMEGSRYFTKLDLSKGYWQIPMCKEDIHKTAFVTPDAHYEFTRMPFGLVNAGATLVRGMRKVLDGIPNVGVYIDDIILYNETFEEHMGNLNKVFQRLKDHNLTIKSTKCSFAMEEIDFIGVKITRGTSLPVKENIEKISKA